MMSRGNIGGPVQDTGTMSGYERLYETHYANRAVRVMQQALMSVLIIVQMTQGNLPKWQKNDLVSGGHGRAAKLGACVNWVDWLRTSADKRMWSTRRAVVMVR